MKKTKRPALDIIAGILLITGGLMAATIHIGVLDSLYLSLPHLGGWFVCSLFSTIFGIIAILCGILFIYKDDWIIPIIGCICAVLTLVLPTVILGGIALILIYISSRN